MSCVKHDESKIWSTRWQSFIEYDDSIWSNSQFKCKMLIRLLYCLHLTRHIQCFNQLAIINCVNLTSKVIHAQKIKDLIMRWICQKSRISKTVVSPNRILMCTSMRDIVIRFNLTRFIFIPYLSAWPSIVNPWCTYLNLYNFSTSMQNLFLSFVLFNFITYSQDKKRRLRILKCSHSLFWW